MYLLQFNILYAINDVFHSQKAHIALIDALMLAFSREIITIERVTQCVRRFTTFNASSELPSDLEDAILFWINKVCVTVQQNLEKTQTGPDCSDTSLKVISLCLQRLEMCNKYMFMPPTLKKWGTYWFRLVRMYVCTYSCWRYSLETSCMDSSWKNSQRISGLP